ncbi:MAG: sensor histidine kinase [Acidobacteria bacterium]|nr:sensor histidine kinase [Acidobacteriota bacterium]
MDGQLPPLSSAQDRGFRRIVSLLIGLVVAPTALLLVIGILMLVLWRSPLNLVFGILVTALVVCLVAGSVIALVLLRREARLSRLQTDFVSKVSHELRTPLTSILMFAEMVSEESADPAERELCIEGIQREALRLQVQIERLLEWGRMEAGQREYRRERLDPGEVIEEAVEVFRGSAQGRELPIRVEVTRSLPAVEGDRVALTDALLNLLGNAVKYTGEEKRIALGASSDGRNVRLFVRDNGPGIPRREQRQIFQKFYRADDRLSRAVEGAGLGLAIVQHVATGHGGRVEVDSEPGKGSTFSIVLPVADERKEAS